MKTMYNNYKITSVYKGTKNWSYNMDNYNNHTIYITNTITKQKCSFEYWNSLIEGEITTEKSLMNAVWYFIQCALTGLIEYEEFIDEFGKNKNSKKTYNSCKKALEKYNRVFMEDIYEIIENLENEYDF